MRARRGNHCLACKHVTTQRQIGNAIAGYLNKYTQFHSNFCKPQVVSSLNNRFPVSDVVQRSFYYFESFLLFTATEKKAQEVFVEDCCHDNKKNFLYTSVTIV